MRQLKIIATVLAALAVPAAVPAAQPAGQGWIREMLAEDPACDPGAVDALAHAARRGIEREVGRREHAVKPPSAAAELSCLGDLMGADLDIAYPTSRITAGLPGFLQGLLMQLLTGSDLSIGSIDAQGLASALAAGQTDPTRVLPSSLCRFAESRWSQATLPALGGFGDLSPLAVLPLLLQEGVGAPNFPQPDLRRRLPEPESQAAVPPGRPGQASRILGLGGDR